MVTVKKRRYWETILIVSFSKITACTASNPMLSRLPSTMMSWICAIHSVHLQKFTKLVNLVCTKNTLYLQLKEYSTYQLGNLSPKFRGSLSSIHLVSIANIHLVSIAKSSVIQK